MPRFKLSPTQAKDLAEVGNIGAGQAASSLSDLIHRRCIIKIPMVRYVDMEGVKKIMDMEDTYVVTLHIKILGDLPALMFVVMQKANAQKLVQYITLSQPNAVAGKDLDFAAQFALKQMGELLTKSFFDAIEQFLSAKVNYTIPEIIMDKWSLAVDSIFQKIGSRNEQLSIDSVFHDPEKTFEGKFIYILNQESQKTALERIDRLYGKKN